MSSGVRLAAAALPLALATRQNLGESAAAQPPTGTRYTTGRNTTDVPVGAAWNATRPPFVEADALSRATYFARIAYAPVHAVHTSSGAALEAAPRQRYSVSDVCIEYCLHYPVHDTICLIA